MTSSRFARRPRIQQPPPTCKGPPLPEPPGKPIELLYATVIWIGQNKFHEPLNFVAAFELQRDWPGEPAQFTGYVATVDRHVLLRTHHTPAERVWDVWLEMTPAGGAPELLHGEAPDGQQFAENLGRVPFPAETRENTSILALITL